jgi:hypothetical protein
VLEYRAAPLRHLGQHLGIQVGDILQGADRDTDGARGREAFDEIDGGCRATDRSLVNGVLGGSGRGGTLRFVFLNVRLVQLRELCAHFRIHRALCQARCRRHVWVRQLRQESEKGCE